MDMNFSTEVFEHSLDDAIIEQIDMLRTIRLNIAESMLNNLPTTSQQLYSRGILVGDMDTVELKHELEQRVLLLKARLAEPHVIYVDEIKLYMNLVDSADIQEAEPLLV